MQEKIQGHNIKGSIAMAFNLGVWMKKQKDQTGNVLEVTEVTKELREMIYWNMSQQHGDTYPSDLLNANLEYFLEIALLGYILPGVCLPDEELKSRLLHLIEARAKGETPQQPFEQHSTATTFHY